MCGVDRGSPLALLWKDTSCSRYFLVRERVLIISPVARQLHKQGLHILAGVGINGQRAV